MIKTSWFDCNTTTIDKYIWKVVRWFQIRLLLLVYIWTIIIDFVITETQMIVLLCIIYLFF